MTLTNGRLPRLLFKTVDRKSRDGRLDGLISSASDYETVYDYVGHANKTYCVSQLKYYCPSCRVPPSDVSRTVSHFDGAAVLRDDTSDSGHRHGRSRTTVNVQDKTCYNIRRTRLDNYVISVYYTSWEHFGAGRTFFFLIIDQLQ